MRRRGGAKDIRIFPRPRGRKRHGRGNARTHHWAPPNRMREYAIMPHAKKPSGREEEEEEEEEQKQEQDKDKIKNKIKNKKNGTNTKGLTERSR